MDTCPKCNQQTFKVIKDSVDIGVGEQEFIIGGECSHCGNLEFCSNCGAWETQEGIKHTPWCDRRKETRP